MLRRSFLLTIYLAATIILSLPVSINAQSTEQRIERGSWQGNEVEYLSNELLVKLKPGVSLNAAEAAFKQYSADIIVPFDPTHRWGTVLLKRGDDALAALPAWENHPLIEACAPNVVMYLYAEPNDPNFQLQWGLCNLGQNPPGGTPGADIHATKAWDMTTGSREILISVLDTGMPLADNGKFSHFDLDDQNRFLAGRDFLVPGPSNVPGIKDEVGHGTHVLGILGAEANNNAGVCGVSWNSRIIVHQIIGQQWGSLGVLALGIWQSVSDGAEVINISAGALVDHHPMVEDAIAAARDQNIIICAAAGNDGREWVGFPANLNRLYDNVIAVAATNQNDQRAPYSNYGGGWSGWNIDIGAPGGHGGPMNGDDIYSTLPGYPTIYSPNGEKFGYSWGTSMATPFVTGAVALIKSLSPNLPARKIRDVLRASADPVAGQPWGRLNIRRALDGLRVASPVAGKNLTHDFRLERNYPNPFNPTTTIAYSLSTPASVSLAVYNLLGERVSQLVSGQQAAGAHEVRWNGRDDSGQPVASGIYLYRMRSGAAIQTRRMILLR